MTAKTEIIPNLKSCFLSIESEKVYRAAAQNKNDVLSNAARGFTCGCSLWRWATKGYTCLGKQKSKSEPRKWLNRKCLLLTPFVALQLPVFTFLASRNLLSTGSFSHFRFFPLNNFGVAKRGGEGASSCPIRSHCHSRLRISGEQTLPRN